jgi:tetratricopeptide (TPR) repeat protein
LSLADVAGGTLTRQAIHLFETGRARPSRRSLELIAARLGRPVDEFVLAVGAEIAGFERMSRSHAYESLLERANTVLQEAATPRLQAWAHRYAGLALGQLGRREEAIKALRQARRLFEILGEEAAAAECLDLEADALFHLGRPEALERTREALERYRGAASRVPEVEARILEHMGTFLARQSSHQQAEGCYMDALRLLGEVLDLEDMARILHGLAGCRRAAGDLRGAMDLLRKAMALYGVEDQLRPVPARAPLTRAENDLGMLLMEQGRLAEAEEVLESAWERATHASDRRLRVWVQASLGELRQRQGRLDEAQALLEESHRLAVELGDPVASAEALRALSELHQVRGEPQLAEDRFREAMGMLEAAGLRERAAELERARRSISSSSSPRSA